MWKAKRPKTQALGWCPDADELHEGVLRDVVRREEPESRAAPALPGVGRRARLFDGIGADKIELETTRVLESPRATHLRFRVVKASKGEGSR